MRDLKSYSDTHNHQSIILLLFAVPSPLSSSRPVAAAASTSRAGQAVAQPTRALPRRAMSEMRQWDPSQPLEYRDIRGETAGDRLVEYLRRLDMVEQWEEEQQQGRARQEAAARSVSELPTGSSDGEWCFILLFCLYGS